MHPIMTLAFNGNVFFSKAPAKDRANIIDAVAIKCKQLRAITNGKSEKTFLLAMTKNTVVKMEPIINNHTGYNILSLSAASYDAGNAGSRRGLANKRERKPPPKFL